MNGQRVLIRPLFKMLGVCLAFIAVLLAMHLCWGVPLQSPAFTIVGLTGGWIVAFLVGRWNAQAARLDEARLTAYRDIKTALSATKLELSRLGQEIRNWESSLDWWNTPHLQAIVKWQTIPDDLEKKWRSSQDSYLKFLTAFESAAILFWDIEQLRMALYEENLQVGQEWSTFGASLRTEVATNPRGPKDAQHVASLRSAAQKISSRLLDVATYLHDFGVALQNHAMGPFVGFHLPSRKPEPPHKTLADVANAARLKK